MATRSTLTTTYEYGDAQWPEGPTVVRTESLVAVLSRRGGVAALSGDDDQRSRRETFAYDAATGTS